jgi:C-terminal processing protease CtpA/Prc
LAMMALPNVTRVGTPTYGVLSDGLPKTLPNGWTVGMSNEVYIAVDGKLYEGLGIPPHMVTSKETTGLLKDRLQRDIQVVLEEAKK